MEALHARIRVHELHEARRHVATFGTSQARAEMNRRDESTAPPAYSRRISGEFSGG